MAPPPNRQDRMRQRPGYSSNKGQARLTVLVQLAMSDPTGAISSVPKARTGLLRLPQPPAPAVEQGCFPQHRHREIREDQAVPGHAALLPVGGCAGGGTRALAPALDGLDDEHMAATAGTRWTRIGRFGAGPCTLAPSN